MDEKDKKSMRLVRARRKKLTAGSAAKEVDAELKDKDDNFILRQIHKQINDLALQMEQAKIADYVELLQKPRKVIMMNLIGGISRGVGIAIGVGFFASTIVYILQALGALNLPIVGDYIAEVVKYVKAQMEGRAF